MMFAVTSAWSHPAKARSPEMGAEITLSSVAAAPNAAGVDARRLASSDGRWLSGSGVYICCAIASSVVRQRAAPVSRPGARRRGGNEPPPDRRRGVRERHAQPVRVLAIGTLFLRKPDVEGIVLALNERARNGLRVHRQRGGGECDGNRHRSR